MSKRNIIILAVVAIIGGAFALCLFCGLIGMITDSGDRQPTAAARATLAPLESAPTEEPTATPIPEEPTPTPEPPTATPEPIEPTPFASPEDELHYNLVQTLGETANRDDLPKLALVQIDGDVINVHFAIDDNLTEDMLFGGTRLDITNILKTISESSLDYSLINIEGTFSLVDKLGNASEETVVWATYDAATISQINWPNFLFDNVYEIATTHKFHPAFEE